MKILKKIEEDLAKVEVDSLASPLTATPAEIIAIIKSLKGVFITVLDFLKLLTSKETDEKIDKLITWLNQLENQ